MDALTTRLPAVAGQFYPDDRDEAMEFLDSLKSKIDREPSDVLSVLGHRISGLIVPHAGWEYSGKTAMTAYSLLESIQPRRIALLGPAHAYPLDGVAAEDHTQWITPLGNVSIIHDEFFRVNNESHFDEHSLEVQMPFIKHFCGDAQVLPLLVGRIDENTVRACAARLAEKEYFVIISTDLSHFHSLPAANEIDRRSISNIERLSHHDIDACGINPLRVAFAYCGLKNTKPRLIDYTTSAGVSGNRSSVVGYASFYF